MVKEILIIFFIRNRIVCIFIFTKSPLPQPKFKFSEFDIFKFGEFALNLHFRQIYQIYFFIVPVLLNLSCQDNASLKICGVCPAFSLAQALSK